MSTEIARRVASAAYFQELHACRRLGYSPLQCFDRAAAVMDDTYNLALDPMPAEVLTRFRTIRT
jgi:hypothetical protein